MWKPMIDSCRMQTKIHRPDRCRCPMIPKRFLLQPDVENSSWVWWSTSSAGNGHEARTGFPSSDKKYRCPEVAGFGRLWQETWSRWLANLILVSSSHAPSFQNCRARFAVKQKKFVFIGFPKFIFTSHKIQVTGYRFLCFHKLRLCHKLGLIYRLNISHRLQANRLSQVMTLSQVKILSQVRLIYSLFSVWEN